MTSSAAKTSVSKEAFLLPREAFPADVTAFIGRGYEGVVVVRLTVAFRASNGRFFGNFRINRFDHDGPLTNQYGFWNKFASLRNKFRLLASISPAVDDALKVDSA